MLKTFTQNAIAAAALCGLMAATAYAWSDPTLVTPDSAFSRHSRVVFDPDGHLHFFFINNRFQELPTSEWWDIFHCKIAQDGSRLTEDLRLDTTQSFNWVYPAPILGHDGKLHVIWADNLESPFQDYSGIYYSRLDTDGNIERYATRIFVNTPDAPRFFQDQDENLSAVWLDNDSLFYGKFDTTGQVLIPIMFVYTPHAGLGDLANLEACMDSEERIHVTYRHYPGIGDQLNLGYSRVSNQGEVLIGYAPLTPEITGIICGRGYIVADEDDNLHMLYHILEYGEGYQHYRKMDQDLNTIYDVIVEDIAFLGQDTGDGDIIIDARAHVAMVWALHDMGIPFQYRFVRYTTEGIPLGEPETILQENGNWPDLAVGPADFLALNYTGNWEGLPGSKILYCYGGQPQAISSERLPKITFDLQISVFPNPFNQKVTFQLQWPRGGDVNVQVMDPAGRMVYNYGGFFLQGRQNLGLEKSLSSGIYFLIVSGDQNKVIKPFVQLK